MPQIGQLVKFYPQHNEVIIWAVCQVEQNRYLTSVGWIDSFNAHFIPRLEGELTSDDCTNRAEMFIRDNYPYSVKSGVH